MSGNWDYVFMTVMVVTKWCGPLWETENTKVRVSDQEDCNMTFYTPGRAALQRGCEQLTHSSGPVIQQAYGAVKNNSCQMAQTWLMQFVASGNPELLHFCDRRYFLRCF